MIFHSDFGIFMIRLLNNPNCQCMLKTLATTCLMLVSILSIKAQDNAATTSAPAESDYVNRPYLGIQFIGSTGIGLQFAYPIGQRWDIRVTGNRFGKKSRTIKSSEEGVDVTSDISFETGGIGLIGDFSLSKKKPGIKLAFGAVYSSLALNITRSYYHPDYKIDLGKLSIQSDMMPVNPYLGMVFGNFKKAKRVVFAFEMGVLYLGKPKVIFTGEGRVGPTANESNTEIIENNIKSAQFYPYTNMSLNFKLGKIKK